jgi:hypothetical protein
VVDNVHNNLLKQYNPRFGEIAVNLEFVTKKQLKQALTEQAEDNLSKRPHRFIGSILLEHGWITNDQIDIVLDLLFKEYA